MTRKVLVVEDEFLIAMELRRTLTEAGYDVVGPVATVSAALSALRQSHPDACVLDVDLRGEPACPVAEALRDMQVPFVLSSAYSQNEIDTHVALAGAANIGKPAPREGLLQAVADLVG
jgi:DNA-binding response OmpR family regulator